jgi:hypothetical protein
VIVLDDVAVEVDAATAAEARRRARATGLLHNVAQIAFRDALSRLLVKQGLDRLHWDLADLLELTELLGGLGNFPEIQRAGAAHESAGMSGGLRDDLRAHPILNAVVEALWPVLNSERVLAELCASLEWLAAASANDLGLHRRSDLMSVADTLLVNELAELFGPPPAGAAAAPEEPDCAYVVEVPSILESADCDLVGEDIGQLWPTDFVTANLLAVRQIAGHIRSVAERAATEQDWRYGYLVIAEAQEF